MNKIIIDNLQVFINTSETTYETFIINEDIVPTIWKHMAVLSEVIYLT
jgi:hypothetical protein